MPVRHSLHIGPLFDGPQAKNEAGRPHHFQPKPNIELKTFNGSNAYFNYYSTPYMDKVQVAALYFEEKDEKWFRNYMVERSQIIGDDLSRALLTKYDKNDFGHIVGTFNKWRQTGFVNSYIKTFEDLWASMLEFNPLLTKSHFFVCIVSLVDCKKKLDTQCGRFKPWTLDKVYALPENEEKKLEALRRKGPYNKGSSSLYKPSPPKTFTRPKTDPKAVADHKSGKPISELKKGQCFKYGDKWSLGHQCKGRTLHNIEGVLQEDDNEEEVIVEASLEEGDNGKEVTLQKNSSLVAVGNSRHWTRK